MGDRTPHRLNVLGPFYVEDGCCTACAMPEHEAPELFAWDDAHHCYVKKQPTTPEELGHMLSAIACADLGCIRYGVAIKVSSARLLASTRLTSAIKRVGALPGTPSLAFSGVRVLRLEPTWSFRRAG